MRHVFTITLAAATFPPGYPLHRPKRTTGREERIIQNYADIAAAVYEDLLISAKSCGTLRGSAAKPTDSTLNAARTAWIDAREPYQTEVTAGNAIVDDWEGKVNAWPLDEGLIDYVQTDLYGDPDANLIIQPI